MARRGRRVARPYRRDAGLADCRSPGSRRRGATWRGQRGVVALWIALPSDALRGGNRLTFESNRRRRLSANGDAAAGPPAVRGTPRRPRPRPARAHCGRCADDSPAADARGRHARRGAPMPVQRRQLICALARPRQFMTTRARAFLVHDDARPSLSGTLATDARSARGSCATCPRRSAATTAISPASPSPGATARSTSTCAFLGRAPVGIALSRATSQAPSSCAGPPGNLAGDASLYWRAPAVLTSGRDRARRTQGTVQARAASTGRLRLGPFRRARQIGARQRTPDHRKAPGRAAQIARSLSGTRRLDIAKGDIIGPTSSALRRIEQAAGQRGRHPQLAGRRFRTRACRRHHRRWNRGDRRRRRDRGGLRDRASGAAQIAERQINLQRHRLVHRREIRRARSPGLRLDIAGPVGSCRHRSRRAVALIRRSGGVQPFRAARGRQAKRRRPTRRTLARRGGAIARQRRETAAQPRRRWRAGGCRYGVDLRRDAEPHLAVDAHRQRGRAGSGREACNDQMSSDSGMKASMWALRMAGMWRAAARSARTSGAG